MNCAACESLPMERKCNYQNLIYINCLEYVYRTFSVQWKHQNEIATKTWVLKDVLSLFCASTSNMHCTKEKGQKIKNIERPHYGELRCDNKETETKSEKKKKCEIAHRRKNAVFFLFLRQTRVRYGGVYSLVATTFQFLIFFYTTTLSINIIFDFLIIFKYK